MQIIRELSVLGMLGGYSFSDVKSRKLNTFWMKCFFMEGLLGTIFLWRPDSMELIWAILPGIAVLLLSKATNEGIGAGDGCLLVICGLFLESELVLEMLCVAVAVSAVWGLFLFVGKKKSREYQMPFVPFMLLGYVCSLFAIES